MNFTHNPQVNHAPAFYRARWSFEIYFWLITIMFETMAKKKRSSDQFQTTNWRKLGICHYISYPKFSLQLMLSCLSELIPSLYYNTLFSESDIFHHRHSISHQIRTRFGCALFCCGYVVNNGLWLIHVINLPIFSTTKHNKVLVVCKILGSAVNKKK